MINKLPKSKSGAFAYIKWFKVINDLYCWVFKKGYAICVVLFLLNHLHDARPVNFRHGQSVTLSYLLFSSCGVTEILVFLV